MAQRVAELRGTARPLEPIMRFSLPDACRKTGLAYSRAYNAIVRGAVPAERTGRAWTIAEADLPALVAAAAALATRDARTAA